MCGIVGALAFEGRGRSLTEGDLDRMRDAVSHRGPDGAGTWLSPDARVGLGHRRLSIIDLSTAAAQPMSNEHGTLWVTFNGEIYNHADIRTELEATGRYRWRTNHSDTEVIVHAFEEWGIRCFERFRGMFAVGIWDAKRKELWLIRDRIGVKPLYWASRDGLLTFASEIKALLEVPGTPRAVDEAALWHYLTFLCVPAPRTLFQGISKLAAGHWLRCDASGNVELRRWWYPWDAAAPLPAQPDAALSERLLGELRTAVKLRKVSDVPVGVFLSGGLDSSTNAALFAEDAKTRVKTYTVGYEGDHPSYRNEVHWARDMAAHVGAEHHERLLTQQDVLDFLPRMIELQDEPNGDAVCAPVFYVSELARKDGTIVCQVGEGADELFNGYPAWERSLKAQALADLPLPQAAWGLGARALDRLGRGRRAELARRAAAGRPLFLTGAETFHEGEKALLVGADVVRRLGDLTSWEEVMAPLHREFLARAWEPSAFHWMTTSDLLVRLPELLLMRVDKMSMGVALEARVPFLDHRVVELALSMPTAQKVRPGEQKRLLKAAVRGRVPDAIIDRKKQGFGVPTAEWLHSDQPLGRLAADTVGRFARASGLLDPVAAERCVARADTRAWPLLILALWWERFIHVGRA
jgi:asparagine synthase (glutamine-hydrolysing)